MKTVTFFNNKGGVGKTSLVYHLAWMYSQLGVNVLAVDLDPQSNLTAAFLPESSLEALWPDGPHPATIHGVIKPLLDRSGDLNVPQLVRWEDGPALLPGDLWLSQLEDLLAETWPKCMDDKATEATWGLKVASAFHRAIRLAVAQTGAGLVLIDVGPSLGSINRAALIATDHVVVPVAADLFSYHALKNLGPTLREWRKAWQTRKQKAKDNGIELDLPEGEMRPIGYVVMQPVTYASRPVKAYREWIAKMPAAYATAVLGEPGPPTDEDANRLGMLRHYRSLVPMAQEAGKPIFRLTPADGAFGSHADAVQHAARDFEALARRIADGCGVELEGR